MHNYGSLLAAAGTLGNAAKDVSDATKVSSTLQTGNEQIDTNGTPSVVAGVPALAVTATVTLNGASGDQKTLAQPSAGLGKNLSFGTDVVQEPNGDIHTQGGSVSVGLTTPNPFPFSVAVPFAPGTGHDDTWQNNGDVNFIDDFEPPIEPK
jgi:hypothetical protein